jgi:hypothetical protein
MLFWLSQLPVGDGGLATLELLCSFLALFEMVFLFLLGGRVRSFKVPVGNCSTRCLDTEI